MQISCAQTKKAAWRTKRFHHGKNIFLLHFPVLFCTEQTFAKVDKFARKMRNFLRSFCHVEHSVNRLKQKFVSVLMSLQRESEERGDAKALGLHRLMSEYRFIATMLLMCDALPHVSTLSKCFQYSTCDYSIIPGIISSTIACLKQLKSTEGRHTSGLPALLEELKKAEIDVRKPHNLGELYFNDSIRKPFLDKLIDNLESRFQEKDIMASFDILKPQRLPQLSTNPSREELKLFTNYGVKELRCFTNQFEGILVNYDSCEEEWSSFRQFLNDPSNKRKSHEAVIDELCTNPTSSRVFPTMSAMASICRVVPVHTSDVERTFSQLKLVKTRIRNRMKEKTLNSLLRIILEGPDLKDFPFEEAIELWAKKKKRRISSRLP